MDLVPRVQFGHAVPGGSVTYREYLLNHFSQDTNVHVDGMSHGGWGMSINPSQLVAHPEVSNTIAITVSIPATVTRWVDTERVRAVSSGAVPYTTTACLVTISGTHEFTDLSSTDWSSDFVQYLYYEGVVSGYSDGSFHPSDKVTRAQLAKMLVGAMGWDIVTPETATFSDVAADNWAYGFVETAYAHGVISGYADGTFAPESAVTRAQLAKMVVNANGWVMQSPDNGGNFADMSVDDWFYDYAATMNAVGVMSGYSDGTFRPYDTTTREQVAKVITLSVFAAPNNE